VLILAGGEGKRLKPVTESIPKPMVEVNGKPFLKHQLELLSKNGISDVVLCVGHLWEHIKDHFGDNFKSKSGKKINIHYSVEPRFLGTGGAVKNAEKYIQDYFFVIYGDTYLAIDLQEMSRIIYEKKVAGVISVYDNHERIVENNVHVDPDGLVIKYDKFHQSPEMNGVEAGTLLFNRSILSLLPDLNQLKPYQKVSLEIDIYPKLINQHQLLGYMTSTRFYDMGTPSRLKIISEVLK
jgi:NDP-sugar pyrophosphorylase family protein